MFGHGNGNGLFGNHVCGLFYNSNAGRVYLPQVELESHTTINRVCYTTQIRQTFRNPNSEVLPKAQYAFPLYDGVAVSGYTVHYAGKVLKGVVKQKDVAKQTYQAAVDRGETAALLESLPAGVFGVTLGNVPANQDVVVEITYCGELKHDAAIDGLRYMLPTSIAPRYGDYPGQLLTTNTIAKKGISITVDVDMATSAIRRVQSPSHPIAVSMGATSTTKSSNEGSFRPSQASATVTFGNAELASDFILQLLIDDISKPQAIIEQHPTLPNQRAIMATLVPKFQLESGHPEIVFIADQSGSMGGSKNTSLVAALKVFLKSLPFGVRFNICAFGSNFKFLWPQSQAYSEDNVNTAMSFVDSFTADYGGTEILKPITAAFKQKLRDLPMEVMLLTDGEVWAEDSIFAYINDQIRVKGVDARVFALGIGNDVSHTLVEGVARAGNGFAQFVTANEDTDQKVVRMLKGALYAHTKDYELEVHYGEENDSSSDDDDFEIVEKVADCLKIDDGSSTSGSVKSTLTKAISFFDTTADTKRTTPDPKGVDRYAHLPPIATPKLLQAPTTIPPLFPFNRSTVYLLLAPDAVQKPVKSVTLRAMSAQGPLEINIPTTLSDSHGSIHHLGARKAIQDLEEGRGWLYNAKTSGGQMVKTKHESRFDELVERESVHLGERFQVAGKWTSFVAVQDGKSAEEEKDGDVDMVTDDFAQEQNRSAPSGRNRLLGGRSGVTARMSTGGKAPRMQMMASPQSASSDRSRYVHPYADVASLGHAAAANVYSTGIQSGQDSLGFGSHSAMDTCGHPGGRGTPVGHFGASTNTTGSLFSNTQNHASSGGFGATTGGSLFGAPYSLAPSTGGSLFGNTGGGSSGAGRVNTASNGFGAAPGGSLFGGANLKPSPAAGGLFGNNQNTTGNLLSNGQQTAGGLFGNSNPVANPGPFVTTEQSGGGLFESSRQIGFTPKDISGNFSSSFGANPFAPGGGLATLPYQPGTGPLFGAAATAPAEAAPAASPELDKTDLLTPTSRAARASRPSKVELRSQRVYADADPPEEESLEETKAFFASVPLANVLERGERLDTLAASSASAFGSAAPPPPPETKWETASTTYVPGEQSFGPGVSMTPAPSGAPPIAARKAPPMAKRKSVHSSRFASAEEGTSTAANSDPLHTIISLQSFSGSWGFSPALQQALNVSSPNVQELMRILSSAPHESDIAVTAMTVAFLETEMKEKQGVWEMVVEKARAWLNGKIGSSEEVEEVIGRAGIVLKENRDGGI